MSYKYHIKCSMCGKFCKPCDSGTLYGNALDVDPPDPEYFCKSCVKKELKNINKVITGCWWIKPNYVTVVNCIRRHNRKINKL